MFEGGWSALLAVATLHRVCWVRAITYTARPALQRTAMGPDIQNLRKYDEIRNTGRGGPMSCSREAGEPCWLLPHSTGSVGSGPSHTQPLQPLSGQPWGLTFIKLDEIRNTGRRGQISCSREAGEPCWLLLHSTGSVGSGPSHTQLLQPSVDSHGA